MEKVMFFVILSVLFLAADGHSPVGSGAEPTCLSRFDHDFKVLQKLVELDQTQKELATKLADLDQKQDRMELQLSKTNDMPSKARCPNGWTRYENSCYAFVDNIELTWQQGYQHCSNLCGSHLASMETYIEQQFLQEHAKKLKSSVGTTKWYWVGATDSHSEGNWVWQPGGQAVSDGGSKWAPGQPASSNSQNCGCLWGDGDYTFHDYICNRAGYVICEKEMGV